MSVTRTLLPFAEEYRLPSSIASEGESQRCLSWLIVASVVWKEDTELPNC